MSEMPIVLIPGLGCSTPPVSVKNSGHLKALERPETVNRSLLALLQV